MSTLRPTQRVAPFFVAAIVLLAIAPAAIADSTPRFSAYFAGRMPLPLSPALRRTVEPFPAQSPSTTVSAPSSSTTSFWPHLALGFLLISVVVRRARPAWR